MANENFNSCFKEIVELEGEFNDIPGDYPTRWGISEPIARKWGYTGLMKDLPLATAEQIYKTWYWDMLRLDEIAKISSLTASELFEFAINSDIILVGKYFQRAINAVSTVPRLTVDGIIGSKTITELAAVSMKGAVQEMLKLFNAQQAVHYMEIAEKRREKRKFLVGWIRKRVNL